MLVPAIQHTKYVQQLIFNCHTLQICFSCNTCIETQHGKCQIHCVLVKHSIGPFAEVQVRMCRMCQFEDILIPEEGAISAKNTFAKSVGAHAWKVVVLEYLASLQVRATSSAISPFGGSKENIAIYQFQHKSVARYGYDCEIWIQAEVVGLILLSRLIQARKCYEENKVSQLMVALTTSDLRQQSHFMAVMLDDPRQLHEIKPAALFCTSSKLSKRQV